MKDSTCIPNFASIRYMDLWLADLPAVPGHVKHGVRPVLVVSNDDFNASSPTLTVVPLTSQRRTLTQPTHVCLRGYGLSVISVAQCEQVMTLDRSCFIRQMGRVSSWCDRLAIQQGLARRVGMALWVNLAR